MCFSREWSEEVGGLIPYVTRKVQIKVTKFISRVKKQILPESLLLFLNIS